MSRAGGELHSGLFGGAIADPLFALCRLAASLRDADGRVTLPGFYDRVRLVGPAERAMLAEVAARGGGPEAAAPDAPVDVDGERGFTAAERTTVRPSLTITGLRGGYQGPGQKTVLGTEAAMKLNFRLVPDQVPAEALAALRRHVEARVPRGLRAQVVAGGAAAPVEIDRGHAGVRAAARAYRRVFGRAPLYRRSAGSIPVAAALKHQLGIEPVLMGFALPDDRAHGPNEKMHLPTFFRGIESSLALLDELGAALQARVGAQWAA